MIAHVERTRSHGEEIANSVTHGIGVALSCTALPIMVVSAAARHDIWQVVACSVFGASLLTLYAISTMYHALRHPGAKRVFRILDHGAIYLLIAGTYTPFTLGALRGGWGWTLFGIVWGLSALGIAAKSIGGIRAPRLSVVVYILMGWLVVIAFRPLVARVPFPGIALLIAGGLLYTAGVAFYGATRVRYSHTVWHLFVLAGSAVIVSHDRWFLDRVATHILAFEGESQVRWFEGNFTEYEALRHKELGAEADQPHRIRDKPLARG